MFLYLMLSLEKTMQLTILWSLQKSFTQL